MIDCVFHFKPPLEAAFVVWDKDCHMCSAGIPEIVFVMCSGAQPKSVSAF
jgi:hypothetical protein